jgi:hypothetical protein
LRENATKYFAIGGSLILLYKLYQLRRRSYTQDTSSVLDVGSKVFSEKVDCPAPGKFAYAQDERDYKEGYSRIPPKVSHKSATTTAVNLQQQVARSLRQVFIYSKGKMLGTVNGIMIASNVIMIPAHAIPRSFPFDIETTASPGVPSAKTKDQKLTEEFCVIDREKDVAFVHLASAPASTSYIDYFPEEQPKFRSRSTRLLWKSPTNEVKTSVQPLYEMSKDLTYYGTSEKDGMLWGTTMVSTSYVLKKDVGFQADLEFNSFGGLCGGLYLDQDKAIIYGMHIAGYPDSNKGFISVVLRGTIRDALSKLSKMSPTMVVHSAGDVRVDAYQQNYSIKDAKPLYLREDGTKEKTTVSFLGRVLKDGLEMTSNARTPYIKTPFVGVVEEFGPSKHRPPTSPNDIAKSMLTLNKLTDPVQHYEGQILMKAVQDYKEQTLKCIRENKEDCSDFFRIYTQAEALDGIGEFGLGGMPNDTSAGFPINKSKKHCLKRDPMDESLVQVPREFSEDYDIQTEVDYTFDCWSNGVRSEPIYKASSKVNELLPNKKAVEKVRKFYGSPIANFVASRRVLAGIPRFMRKFWRDTECLVGINATSKEWDELHSYVTSKSKDRMIAGDFSGFDTRMAAQITGAAAKVMLSWYEECGVIPDELKLIQGALSDIIHPNILFDGDLYRFANGNPSGNLITVQLNSICNSIMMRYVYYAMMPSIKESFSQNVALATYGDDNAMSVRRHCGWFTHTSCQAEFEKLGIGYTMAQKDAKSRPYIGIEEVSFLKRSFVQHKDLGKIVAPIEVDSILKKFHYIKKPTESPLSPGEQFAAYADGSLREMFLYGRHDYEVFLIKLKNIVGKNPELKGRVSFILYDEMKKLVEPAYAHDYVNDNRKLFAESMDLAPI